MFQFQRHLTSLAASFDGDPVAFSTLFEIYRSKLLSHALYICGNTPNAEDAVQDTFITAYTKLDTLRDKNLLFPWLKKILENHCFMMMRKNKYVSPMDTLPQSDTLLEESIESHFVSIANHQAIWQSVSQLSEELRSCVLLRYFSEFKSYDEIATVLDIPVGTVRSRLNAARTKLYEIFHQNPDPTDACLKEARYWTEYYTQAWNNIHDDLETRNDLLNHFHPQLMIRFTSGARGQGRRLLEEDLDNDLIYGSSIKVKEVISSGSISVIEASSYNSPEYPNRCAPSTAFVAFREKGIVHTAHIFDSPRP